MNFGRFSDDRSHEIGDDGDVFAFSAEVVLASAEPVVARFTPLTTVGVPDDPVFLASLFSVANQESGVSQLGVLEALVLLGLS